MAIRRATRFFSAPQALCQPASPAGTVYFMSATDPHGGHFQVSPPPMAARSSTHLAAKAAHTLVSVLDTFTYACQYVRSGGGGGYLEPPDQQN